MTDFMVDGAIRILGALKVHANGWLTVNALVHKCTLSTATTERFELLVCEISKADIVAAKATNNALH